MNTCPGNIFGVGRKDMNSKREFHSWFQYHRGGVRTEPSEGGDGLPGKSLWPSLWVQGCCLSWVLGWGVSVWGKEEGPSKQGRQNEQRPETQNSVTCQGTENKLFPVKTNLWGRGCREMRSVGKAGAQSGKPWSLDLNLQSWEKGFWWESNLVRTAFKTQQVALRHTQRGRPLRCT